MSKPEGSSHWFMRYLPGFARSRLEGRRVLLMALNNSSWLLLERLVRLVLGLLVVAWVARYLGPAQYGELAYVLAYMAFFSVLAALGLDGIVLRDVARDSTIAGETLGTMLYLRLSIGLFSWLLAVAGMVWIHGWEDRSVWIAALVGSMLVFTAVDSIDIWFQSQSQSRRTVLVKLVALLLTSAVKVLLILLQAPLIAFAAVTILDGLITAIGLILAYRSFPVGQAWHFKAARAKQLLAQSWPLIISGLSITFYSRVDQLLIKQMLGEHALGIYTAVIPFTGSWMFIPAIITTSVSPILSRIRMENRRDYQLKLAQLLRLNALIALAIAIALYAFSDLITQLFLGAEYRDSAAVLAILGFTNIFVFIGICQGIWVINEGWRWIVISSTLAASISSFALNLLFIPRYGVNGAAYASLLTLSISVVLVPLLLSSGLRRVYRFAFLGGRYA